MNPRDLRQNPDHLPPKRGEPALHAAARLGDHEAIRRLVGEGRDVNRPFDIRLDPGARPTNATPLMVAAGSGEGGTVDTMRLLRKLGAQPLCNHGSGTAARFAATGLGWNYLPGGDGDRLRLCLDLGCDPDETDARGVTLVADAAASGDSDRVRALLECGARPDAAGRASRVPRLPGMDVPYRDGAPWSFQIPLHNAVEADNVDAARRLIAAGADVYVVDHENRTALFSASSPAMARMLIDAGLDIEARDCYQWSPLVAAIGEGSIRGVEALLAVGADPSATHDRGFTVFMSAVGSDERRPEIIDVLINAGANPHAVSELGWNAFHAAIDVDGVEANTEESVRSTFERLVALGVDVNQRDNRGATPLERARQLGTALEIRVLSELGLMAGKS